VGWPARVYGLGGRGYGLRPRYRRPSTTRARAPGCPGFFARMGNFESPHHFPKRVDHFQIAPHCQCLRPRFSLFFNLFSGVFFTVTSESCRLSCFLVCHRPPFLTATSGKTARRRVGGYFSLSFFFLLTSSFAARSPHFYPPHRRTRPPFPSRTYQAPLPTATTHDALSSPHAPCHLASRGPPPCLALRGPTPCLALRGPTPCLALRGYTHRVAVPASPCFLRQPTLLVRFSFSFSGNFLFCSPVTALSPPSLLTDARPSSPKAYHGAITYHDDNATTTMTSAEAAHSTTATTIATPYSVMT
jgi:hypothetical protein